MTEESEGLARPRTSRFKEHTNTNNSIRPPPDELWKDLGIEKLIEQFNEENKAPPSRNTSDVPVTNGHAVHEAAQSSGPIGAPSLEIRKGLTSGTAAASESTFGRFQRVFTSVFGGVLGKRKAGNVDAEKNKEKKVLDERKKAADAAYQEAKELGLLPAPKVFVRQGGTTKPHKNVDDTPTPICGPRAAKLHRMPSKRDLQKQRKLSKRVSELELKLASAKAELQLITHNECLPTVPPLSATLPPTPSTSRSEADSCTPRCSTETARTISSADPTDIAQAPAPVSERPTRRAMRKRKVAEEEDDKHKSVAASSDDDITMTSASWEAEESSIPERKIKRVKSASTASATTRKTVKKQQSSPRLQRKKSKTALTVPIPIIVVPDGVSVPMVPEVPKGVKGKKTQIEVAETKDDGYGGLEHEMF